MENKIFLCALFLVRLCLCGVGGKFGIKDEVMKA